MFGMTKKSNYEKTAFGKHIEGLPIPQNTPMTITLSQQELKLTGGGQEFKINFQKLHSIIPSNDVEIEKTSKSSATGAIVGAAAFGVTGAIIGGRPKTVDSKKLTAFIQINYESDGFKSIVFNVQSDWQRAFNIVKYFNSIKPDTVPVQVEL